MTRSVPMLHFVGRLACAAGLVFVSASACAPEIEKLWAFPTSSPLYSTPLVVDDLIVFGSESGTLHAVDRNGKARWQYSAPSAEIFARPVTDGGKIFFGATNQTFYAVDMSGQLKWKYSTKERIKSDAAVSEGVVYTTSYDGHVYALNTKRGQRKWQFPPAKGAGSGRKKTEVIVPKEFSYAAPAVKDGVLYVGNLDGYLYALSTADGSLKWRFKTGGGVTSSALVEGQTVYFGSKDDNVYAIDAATGTKVLWKFETGGDVISSPKIIGGVLYIGSNDKNFYALEAKTGKEKCHFTTKGEVVSYGTFYKDLVFFGGGQGDGHIYGIEQGTCKKFFRYKTGYKIESDPVIVGDFLYVTSGDRKLYAFRINKTARQE